MRVGGVRVDRDDRRFVGAQPARTDTLEHEALQAVLRAGAVLADAPCDLAEGLVHDCAQMKCGAAVKTASKRWIRSAALTTSTPVARTSSSVPASTRET